MLKRQFSYDTVVIGGGPAGSTVATFLAQKGRRVVILEREQFPRYSVGESMLPYCYFPLERIGIIDKMMSSRFTQKHSVQFVRIDSEVSLPFYFFEHMDHPAATTWQVERSEFDLMLLNHARENGVDVFESTAVKEFVKNDQDQIVGVKAQSKTGAMSEFRGSITVDASGQHCFTAVRNGWRIRDKKLKKIAIWTYYKGARRDPGLDGGATTIAYLSQKNWVWYIPLQNDIVSVGIVGDIDYLYVNTRHPEQIFQREIKKNKWVRAHLKSAQPLGKYHVTGDISYRSRYCATDGLVIVGDAYAFLDPVFSSGLFLALYSGVIAGEAIDRALRIGDHRADGFSNYSNELREGVETMRKLVYAFYDPNFSFGSVIKEAPQLKGDLTDCLIGNLHRDFTELFNTLAQFTDLPEPLEYGSPLVRTE